MTKRMTAKQMQAFLAEHFPQIAGMNFKIKRADAKGIVIGMAAEDRHLRPGGTVSGPSMVALADCAIWLAIMARLGPMAMAVTTNLNINFLRKPPAADMVAKGRLLKLGKRLAVGEVTLFSGRDPDPVAHATMTYSIPPDGKG
jgi:uncharacterized protein (TIGR00369 family)